MKGKFKIIKEQQKKFKLEEEKKKEKEEKKKFKLEEEKKKEKEEKKKEKEEKKKEKEENKRIAKLLTLVHNIEKGVVDYNHEFFKKFNHNELLYIAEKLNILNITKYTQDKLIINAIINKQKNTEFQKNIEIQKHIEKIQKFKEKEQKLSEQYEEKIQQVKEKMRKADIQFQELQKEKKTPEKIKIIEKKFIKFDEKFPVFKKPLKIIKDPILQHFDRHCMNAQYLKPWIQGFEKVWLIPQSNAENEYIDKTSVLEYNNETWYAPNKKYNLLLCNLNMKKKRHSDGIVTMYDINDNKLSFKILYQIYKNKFVLQDDLLFSDEIKWFKLHIYTVVSDRINILGATEIQRFSFDDINKIRKILISRLYILLQKLNDMVSKIPQLDVKIPQLDFKIQPLDVEIMPLDFKDVIIPPPNIKIPQLNVKIPPLDVENMAHEIVRTLDIYNNELLQDYLARFAKLSLFIDNSDDIGKYSIIFKSRIKAGFYDVKYLLDLDLTHLFAELYNSSNITTKYLDIVNDYIIEYQSQYVNSFLEEFFSGFEKKIKIDINIDFSAKEVVCHIPDFENWEIEHYILNDKNVCISLKNLKMSKEFPENFAKHISKYDFDKIATYYSRQIEKEKKILDIDKFTPGLEKYVMDELFRLEQLCATCKKDLPKLYIKSVKYPSETVAFCGPTCMEKYEDWTEIPEGELEDEKLKEEIIDLFGEEEKEEKSSTGEDEKLEEEIIDLFGEEEKEEKSSTEEDEKLEIVDEKKEKQEIIDNYPKRGYFLGPEIYTEQTRAETEIFLRKLMHIVNFKPIPSEQKISLMSEDDFYELFFKIDHLMVSLIDDLSIKYKQSIADKLLKKYGNLVIFTHLSSVEKKLPLDKYSQNDIPTDEPLGLWYAKNFKRFLEPLNYDAKYLYALEFRKSRKILFINNRNWEKIYDDSFETNWELHARKYDGVFWNKKIQWQDRDYGIIWNTDIIKKFELIAYLDTDTQKWIIV